LATYFENSRDEEYEKLKQNHILYTTRKVSDGNKLLIVVACQSGGTSINELDQMNRRLKVAELKAATIEIAPEAERVRRILKPT